jgi:hypothetical protein
VPTGCHCQGPYAQGFPPAGCSTTTVGEIHVDCWIVIIVVLAVCDVEDVEIAMAGRILLGYCKEELNFE